MRTLVLTAALLLIPGVSQAQDWEAAIDAWISESWTKVSDGRVRVGDPYDLGGGTYYPFLRQVKSAVCGALTSKGLRVLQQGAEGDAEYSLTLNYRVVNGGIRLDLKLLSNEEGELVEGGLLSLSASQLPPGWSKRSLRDIASELKVKLLEQTLGSNDLSVVFGEFSGGKEEQDGLVGELSATLKDYLLDELSSTNAITLVVGKTRSVATNFHTLQGRFSVNRERVRFALTLVSPKGEVDASATSTLPIRDIPPGLSLFPANKALAQKLVDPPKTLTPKTETPKATPAVGAEPSIASDVTAMVWVNHEGGIYRDGDELRVYLTPKTDCYARVYYIQSDGTVFQIFPPPNHDGRLTGGVTMDIGSEQSGVELTVNDETLGQEFIKVFTSRHPIDDSALPKTFIDGAGVFHMKGGYDALKRGIKTRGLTVKRRVLRPSEEIKILIAGKKR